MKTIFFSHMKRPTIVVKPMKVNSDNDIIQEPKRVYFDNHYFQTDDEEIIEFIQKLPNFGADYVLVDDIKRVEDKSPKVSIVGMNTPEQEKDNEVANLKKEVSGIKNSIEELKGLILQVASKRVEEPISGSDPENKETPVDEVKKHKKPTNK